MKIITGLVCIVMLLTVAGAMSQGAPPTGDDRATTIEQLEARINEMQTTLVSHEKRLARMEDSLRPLLGQAGAGRSGDRPEGKAAEDLVEPLIGVTVTNKRFQASDVRAGRFQDFIWFDATYVSRFEKMTRSIKGTLQFCDLFGDPQFQIRVTIDDPIAPDKEVTTTGVGFEYNQFMDQHNWMRTTALADMTFQFKLDAVLFADGTREND